MLPTWYSTFLIVANTSITYISKRVESQEDSALIKQSYAEIFKILKNYNLSERQLTTEKLAFYIKEATSQVKADQQQKIKQSFLSKILLGDKKKQSDQVVGMVGDSIFAAAKSMKRFEGIYFTD